MSTGEENDDLLGESGQKKKTGWKLLLKPRTRKARRALAGKRRFTVEQFPFCIGRISGNTGSSAIVNDLNLRSEMPHHVSRAHLAFTFADEKPQIVDRGSRLGCIVNGRMIGAAFGMTTLDLEEGENTLCIGHPSGELIYTVLVSKV